VLLEGRVIQDSPLEAAEAVEKGGVIARARDAVMALARRWILNGVDLLLAKAGFSAASHSPSSVGVARQ